MIREGIKARIKESELSIEVLATETGISKKRLEGFVLNGTELNIDELENLAKVIDYDAFTEAPGYVSQAGRNNVNVQIVSFGDEGEKLIEAISGLVSKMDPRKIKR